MTTLCEATRYIADNAEQGKESEFICTKVLRHALAMSVKIEELSLSNTDGYLYWRYIKGGENLPKYTEWAVDWFFEQTKFPKELPRSWDGNPIIDNAVFLPDMMEGLKKAAEKFIKDKCGDLS